MGQFTFVRISEHSDLKMGSSLHGVPVPANDARWRFPPPLSLIDTFADREPVVDGVNVTRIKQRSRSSGSASRGYENDDDHLW